MALALVVGMTNVLWMIALACAVFVEQAVPHGDRARVLLGAALIVAGLLQL